MIGLAKVLEYFDKGYAVYFGSYYGDSLYESAEEIQEEWEEDMADKWLYIQSVDVDDEAHEIYIFIGNDE